MSDSDSRRGEATGFLRETVLNKGPLFPNAIFSCEIGNCAVQNFE